MSAFCGDPTCAARVVAFESSPGDRQVIAPCPACLEALADVMLDAQAEALARFRGYSAPL